MKLTKLSLALVGALALSACASKKPKEEAPAETAGTDKAKEAEDNKARAQESYDAAVKAEAAGEYMNARDAYFKAQSYVPDFKDVAQRLKNLEPVIAAQQSLETANKASDPKAAEIAVVYADALRAHGDLALAMDQAEKAVQANPTLAAARAELAIIDVEAGRP